MISDYTEIIELTMKKPNDAKLDLLVEGLQHFVSVGQKVLIFTGYVKTVEYLQSRLSTFFPEANVESLTGETKDKAKLEILKRFALVAHGLPSRRRKQTSIS